ncbi:MAG: lytic transglycosylase domain-containing protein [Rhodoblastus sp.]
MAGLKRGFLIAALSVAPFVTGAANAAQCGNNSAGFENWKRQFAEEARGRVGPAAIAAVMGSNYARATIGADRGQHGFKLSLDQFMAKRGGGAIVSRGKKLKATHAALFAQIEQRYGVPAGPLLAIWGMETGFGAVRGRQHLISAVATLAYDCRRSAYFTEQLYAALKLIDRGVFNANTIASMHGEVGQTQFMPKAVLAYAVGNLETSTGALLSTANFLKAHGWRAGAGYQPGEANFAVLQEWNAASVYQRAIAIIGARIDGGR